MEMMGSQDERRRGRGGGQKERRGEERGRKGDRWRGKVVVEGLTRGKGGGGLSSGEGLETGISGSKALLA